MSPHDPEAHALLLFSLERNRQRLIERAATEGLTPEEVRFAETIEGHFKREQEEWADKRERGE